MEYFLTAKEDGSFIVDGIPDGMKVIRIDGPKAKRLADLSLHQWDLEFAASCLEAINQVPDEPYVIRTALWNSAIIHYTKCFGDNAARFQLHAESIYEGNGLI